MAEEEEVMNKRVLLTIVLGVALGACSAIGIQTDGQKIATACIGASASLKVLTAANVANKLTYEQQSAVLTAISVISPICAAEQAPDLDDVRREAFLAAISALQLAAVKVDEVTP